MTFSSRYFAHKRAMLSLTDSRNNTPQGIMYKGHVFCNIPSLQEGTFSIGYIVFYWFQAFAVFWACNLWVVHRRVVFNSRRLEHFISTRLWRWNRHSVPKRRLLNTTRWGTTQMITRYIVFCWDSNFGHYFYSRPANFLNLWAWTYLRLQV
jgi:hypothetical protein